MPPDPPSRRSPPRRAGRNDDDGPTSGEGGRPYKHRPWAGSIPVWSTNALPCAYGNPKVYAFVELGGERVYARFFFPQGASVLEDPATGSACANLGGYYLATGAALPLRRLIQQGDMTG